MPTITKEAEAALMQISREKTLRIAKLERDLSHVLEIARHGIEAGSQSGATLWREALERIVRAAKD
jgi:hypothetical protein